MSEAYKKTTSHGSISIPVAMRRELGIEGKDPMIVESNGALKEKEVNDSGSKEHEDRGADRSPCGA